MIQRFLSGQSYGVVSSVNSAENKPESAVVAFTETEDLEIIFGTFSTTRKHRNLLENPNACFVTGWDNITIQYEGVATKLEGEAFEEARQRHMDKKGGPDEYTYHPLQTLFKLTPCWVRYTAVTLEPPTVYELDLTQDPS